MKLITIIKHSSSLFSSEHESNRQQETFGTIFVYKFFTCVLTIYSVWVVITHIARVSHISFFNLSLLFSIILIPILYFHIKKQWLDLKWSEILLHDDIHTVILLLVLAVIGGAISFGIIRPSLDDVDYTSQAVYLLHYPHESLNLARHDHGLFQEPMYHALYIFYTLGLFCAYLARLFHVPFLHVYHWFLPALGGMMIPLAWFLLFTKFSNRTMSAVLAATAVCVFLSLNGNPPRSFGNFAFVRIWQGKAMVMSIVVPLFLTFTLDFFQRPLFSRWKRLCLLLVTTSGLSATASFFMPLLGIIGGGSYWLSQRGTIPDTGKKLVGFGLAYVYLIGVACYFLLNVNKDAITYLGMSGWPTTFAGQFKLVFIGMWSYPSIMLVACVGAALFMAKTYDRRFIFMWLCLCFFLCLNPIVFPIVSRYVSSLNHYWRLFYLLPFPFVIGYPVALLVEHRWFTALKGYALFIALLLVGIGGNVLLPAPYASVGTFRRPPLMWGQHKIYPQKESEVRQIIATSRRGPMLAPDRYSAFIPMYSPDLPQVSVRRYMLMYHAIARKNIPDAEMKFRAVDYVSGISSAGIQDVISLVDRGVKNIILDKRATTWDNWLELEICLKQMQFRLVEKNNRFLLYTK